MQRLSTLRRRFASSESAVLSVTLTSRFPITDRLGVVPEAGLMVDDQPQHVDAARAAGLRAHLHEPARLGDLIARLEAEGALDGRIRPLKPSSSQ